SVSKVCRKRGAMVAALTYEVDSCVLLAPRVAGHSARGSAGTLLGAMCERSRRRCQDELASLVVRSSRPAAGTSQTALDALHGCRYRYFCSVRRVILFDNNHSARSTQRPVKGDEDG